MKKIFENSNTVTCKMKIIDSVRIMATSQSRLIDNPAKVLARVNAKVVSPLLTMRRSTIVY